MNAGGAWREGAVGTCFLNGPLELQNAVRDVIRSNFRRQDLGIEFVGFDKCKVGDESFPGRVYFGDKTFQVSFSRWVGRTLMPIPFEVPDRSATLFFARGACEFEPEDACIKRNALHEFGHFAGLLHEQNRPENEKGQYCTKSDGQGTFRHEGPAYEGRLNVRFHGEYDQFSVMNYCAVATQLSAGDRATLIRLYGADGAPPAAPASPPSDCQ